jgi:hypothetical protein
MDSPCVLDGILQLSAGFSGRSKKLVQRRGVGALHLQAMSSPFSFSDFRLLVGFVLARTLLFVEDVPDTWKLGFYGNGPSFGFVISSSIDATQQRIWVSSLTLISRLGMSPPLPYLDFFHFLIFVRRYPLANYTTAEQRNRMLSHESDRPGYGL